VNDRSAEPAATAVGALHEKFVLGRRARVLAGHLAALIPPHARVLDVGCGDGIVAQLIATQLPDVSIEGIDVLVRPAAKIPVRAFDGTRIPYPDQTFDVAMFVDVLHHADDPLSLLREAARVATRIVIKDHLREGFLAGPTLRFMDWVGNARHGVALTYAYWSEKEWDYALQEAGLRETTKLVSLGLYPVPVSWFFERRLHFIARFEPSGQSEAKASS